MGSRGCGLEGHARWSILVSLVVQRTLLSNLRNYQTNYGETIRYSGTWPVPLGNEILSFIKEWPYLRG